VLVDFSFRAHAGQKIAIVGSSGSGKTSLIMTLLKLTHVHHGSIMIDGSDVSTLDSNKLRYRINVVPQEPYFMPGVSVRENLDPRSEIVDDEAIIAAARKVGLWDKLNLKGGMSAEFVASEWSHGEQQLLSLARALMSGSKLLVLDEATSKYV
jgi:ABC-type multidrug transport system fused ATPase/permease subunit